MKTTNQPPAILNHGSAQFSKSLHYALLFPVLAVLWLLATSPGLRAAAYYYAGQNALPIAGMEGAAYGNNTYVVVGNGGNIFRSADATNWIVVKPANITKTNYNSIVFAQGEFVAVDANGGITTSYDGANWSAQTSGTTNILLKVAWLNGAFFAVGNAGTVLTSANGTNWTAQSFGHTNEFDSATYGNGKYVLGSYSNSSEGGNNEGYVFSSSTGTGSWTSKQISSNDGGVVNFVGWLNNKFYALLIDTTVWTSTDGVTWTKLTSAPILNSPDQAFGGIYTNGTYYLYGSDSSGTYGAIFTSTDGATFTENLPKTFTDVVISMMYANGHFIEASSSGFAISTDANHWRFPAGNYTSVAYNGTNYVVVGYVGSDGYVATSPDWINWTNTTPVRTPNLNGVACGNGEFVAVGSVYANVTNAPILTSSDGINWNVTNSSVSNVSFYSVATDNNGTFVAVGDGGTILRSVNNGVSWTSVNSGVAIATNGLLSVAYINSQFVAVGNAGAVIYSSTGASWTNASYSDTGSTMFSVTYGSGGYVLAGVDDNYNTLFLKRTSLATGSWAAPTTPPPSVAYYEYGGLLVTYVNGEYLGFYNDPNNEGYFLTSTDGNTWVQNDLHSQPLIFGMTYAAGSLRLVGFADFIGRASFTNLPPVIQAVTQLYTENTTLNFSATNFNSAAVYSDASGNPLAGIQIVTLPSASAGTLLLAGAPVQTNVVIAASDLAYLSFVPATNYTATTTFTWQASDGLTNSASAVYTLSTTPPNTPPSFVGGNTNLLVGENAGATDITGLLHVSDPDISQTETWSQSSAPAHGTLAFSSATAASGGANIAPGGTITYTPAANYTGSDSFAVQVSDGNGGSAIRTIAVTVNPPPVITSGTTAGGVYGNAFNYTITATNSPLSYGATGLPASLSVDPLTGVISGTLKQSGSFPITISATNATSFGLAVLNLSVTQANLTVSGIIASNKVYDGTTTASLNLSGAVLNGVVSGDLVSLNTSGVAAAFASSNVGTGINVTISGLALAGADATNYTLTQPTATASITPAPATLTFSNLVYVYDGTAKSVSVSTAPPGLANTVTYNGSATPPSNAGDYTVVGTITNPNYQGGATNELIVVAVPITLKSPMFTNAAYQFTFTNVSGVTFTAISSTNLLVNLTNWTVLGTSTEVSPGLYQFTDSRYTNNNYRFYMIRFP